MDLSKEDGDRRNSLPYPMELGSPAFAPVPVEREKDVILNVGRMHAQQEYDRIMQQVEVLKQQADALQQRLQKLTQTTQIRLSTGATWRAVTAREQVEEFHRRRR